MKKVSLWKLLAPLVVAIIVWFLGVPEGLTEGSWIFVSIFAGLVVGLILEPIPAAFIGIISIVVSVLFKVGPDPTNVVTAKSAIQWGLSGFGNDVVWLIFAAFMIGIGYQNSGLGRRVALVLVEKLGKSSLGLGYAVAITDGILGPFIPSNAARSGGIIYPIVSSISPMFDSLPDKNPKKIGKFLTWTSFATTCVSSSMYLTGQAPNPLAMGLAVKAGAADLSWGNWFLAFLPVGIILFIITPLLAYVFVKPEVKGSPEIVHWAKDELAKAGKMSTHEILMALISILALVLWVGAKTFAIDPTTTALIVIVLMVGTGIITWDNFLANKPAWNVLVWFATLVPMAGGLKNVGFLTWIGGKTGALLHGLDSFMAVLVLVLVFAVLRYFFASATAYSTAMVGLFTALAYSIPGESGAYVVASLLLPMGIMGILTPYTTGHSPIWYASGYIKGGEYWKLGIIFGIIYLGIFIIVGMPWLTFILPILGIH